MAQRRLARRLAWCLVERLARWLRGTNQRLLWNTNDRSSVEGGLMVADSMNGG